MHETSNLENDKCDKKRSKLNWNVKRTMQLLAGMWHKKNINIDIRQKNKLVPTIYILYKHSW